MSRPWPFLLMAASLALLGVISLLGYLAHARQQAMALGLLRDYSAVAAWNYKQRAVADLRQALNMELHAAHRASGGMMAFDLVPRDRLVARWRSDCECVQPSIGALHLLYSTRRDTLLTNDTLPAGVSLALLRERLLTADILPQGSGPNVVHLDAENLLAVDRGMPTGDTLLFGAVVAVSALTPVLEKSFTTATLLPPTLTRGRAPGDLITVRVKRVGRPDPIFVTDSAGDAMTFDTFPRPFNTFIAAVSIKPAAADLLVIGGAQRSRLPLFAALFIVAAALTWLASAQLLRERRFVDSRERFVASVSHELRTPLAQMQLFVDTLQMGRAASAQEQAWALSQIGSETTRLRHLVENVLHVARGNHGPGSTTPVVECAPELREVANAFAPLLAQRNARIQVDLEEDVQVRIQPEHLRQILLNLLDNAAKYGPSGQTIKVALRSTESEAIIDVEDQGAGVTRDEVRRIWERFARGSAADVTGTGGTGIGLAIVRELVERYGGTATVEAGTPCCFRVRLPLDRAASPRTLAMHK